MSTNQPNLDPTSSDTPVPDDQLAHIPKTSAATQASNALKTTDSGALHQMATPETAIQDKSEKVGVDARTKISNLLKDKEREWTAVVARKGPLRLLDLPMDVLKEIVKEVTHTNDLTALALTHSALYNLAIPHIYSRFDIVWPDAHATADPRTGVDALTYGLATLCMGEVFTDYSEPASFNCTSCGAYNIAECRHAPKSSPSRGQRRLGNSYPQYTRKFSLGNGPADWVQEYLITKESGKMLGTLVAIAVAKMINLETFVWDMPTGVLRDVWLALSSLQGRASNNECRLERVWVRWHDNSETSNLPPPQNPNPTPSSMAQVTAGSTFTSIGWSTPAGAAPDHHLVQNAVVSYANSRIEYPSLSVLPPLKSLSVLDIDEVDYLDEMSVLIAKSKERLRELRVGISSKAIYRDFAIAWDGPVLQQVDREAKWPGASRIGPRRLGGVLGVLVGRIFDIRKKPKVRADRKDELRSTSSLAPITTGSHLTSGSETTPLISTSIDVAESSQESQVEVNTGENVAQQHVDLTLLDDGLTSPNHVPNDTSLVSQDLSSPSLVTFNIPSLAEGPANLLNNTHNVPTPPETATSLSGVGAQSTLVSNHSNAVEEAPSIMVTETSPELPLRRSQSHNQRQSHFSENTSYSQERLEGKLRLHTLELERVTLSIVVLQKAFDWSVLTNLTILDCPQHEKLWSMLRRHFSPTPIGGHPTAKQGPATQMQYHLNLQKIHANEASPSLIAFLKETLAPNTLETLFLQDRKSSSSSSVSIDAIYRGPLKRHRASIRKLMLDSSERTPRGPANVASENRRWRLWMPNRDVLNFITSGRMSSLKELSIAIDYKDWHHFLQRLPQIPHLRSLNIPFVADHVTPIYDPRELALQVVDVIVLRPEVELCYMGISHKCFEILENRPNDETQSSGDSHSHMTINGAGPDEEDDDEDEDGTDEDDEDDEEEEEEEDNGTAIAPIDPDETESELSDHDDSDTDSFLGSEDGRSKIRLRLREILFYDDKVAIFKARHGKL
ncbi:hypothetical protein B7463_g7575, partial [Scytalidium lignicola]